MGDTRGKKSGTDEAQQLKKPETGGQTPDGQQGVRKDDAEEAIFLCLITYKGEKKRNQQTRGG